MSTKLVAGVSKVDKMIVDRVAKSAAKELITLKNGYSVLMSDFIKYHEYLGYSAKEMQEELAAQSKLRQGG